MSCLCVYIRRVLGEEIIIVPDAFGTCKQNAHQIDTCMISQVVVVADSGGWGAKQRKHIDKVVMQPCGRALWSSGKREKGMFETRRVKSQQLAKYCLLVLEYENRLHLGNCKEASAFGWDPGFVQGKAVKTTKTKQKNLCEETGIQNPMKSFFSRCQRAQGNIWTGDQWSEHEPKGDVRRQLGGWFQKLLRMRKRRIQCFRIIRVKDLVDVYGNIS